MRKAYSFIKVKLGEKAELLLNALAFVGGTDRGTLLARLVEEAADRQGLTSEAASKILEGRKKSTDSLGGLVRSKRLDRKLSQQAWGKLFGLSQSNVAFIELGKRQLPRHLQEPVAQWLLDGLDPVPPKDEDQESPPLMTRGTKGRGGGMARNASSSSRSTAGGSTTSKSAPSS